MLCKVSINLEVSIADAICEVNGAEYDFAFRNPDKFGFLNYERVFVMKELKLYQILIMF